MSTYTYNRFKSTSIFGQFNNIDLDPSNNAVATFQRNVNVGGDISANNIFCNDISCNDLYLARGLTTSDLTESIFSHLVRFNGYIHVAGAGLLIGSTNPTIISSTELKYLSGCSSNIQNQINNIVAPTSLSLESLNVSGEANVNTLITPAINLKSNGTSLIQFTDELDTALALIYTSQFTDKLTISALNGIDIMSNITIPTANLQLLNVSGMSSLQNAQMSGSLTVSGICNFNGRCNFNNDIFLGTRQLDDKFINIYHTVWLFNNTYLSGDLLVNGFTITPTELTYLDGLTSNIQTQINSKLTVENGAIQLKSSTGISLIEFMDGRTDTLTGMIYSSQSSGKMVLSADLGYTFYGGALEIPTINLQTLTLSTIFNLNCNIIANSRNINPTEVSYLNGVTSRIQLQLDSKLATNDGAITLKSSTGISLIEFMDETDFVTGLIYISQPSNKMIFDASAGFIFYGGALEIPTINLQNLTLSTSFNLNCNILVNSQIITPTEISYLDGCTSLIQRQLNNKLDVSSTGVISVTTGNIISVNSTTINTNTLLATTIGGNDFKCVGSIQLKDVSGILPKIQFYASDASGGANIGEIYANATTNKMTFTSPYGFDFNGNILSLTSTTVNATDIFSSNCLSNIIGGTDIKSIGTVQLKNNSILAEIQFYSSDASGNTVTGKIFNSPSLNAFRMETSLSNGFQFNNNISTTGNVNCVNSNATILKATGSVQVRNVGTIPELQFFNTNAGNALNGKIYTSQALNFMRFDVTGLNGFEFSGGTVYVPSLSTSGTASIGTGNITTINSTTTNATTLKATGSVQLRNVGTIPELIFYNTDSANQISAKIYTSQSTGIMRFDCLNSISSFEFNNGTVRLGKGFLGKQGQNGATYGNVMNRFWTGSALQAWVDTTNIGNFTICDHRIKENIQPPCSVLDRLCNIPMFCYELKDIGIFKKKGTHIGFYAHELEEAFPELNNIVDGEKDAVTDEGEIQPQTVTSELCNVLMRCIQEQNVLIKSLTQRVTELEQKLISL